MLPDGRQRVVRHGHDPVRAIQTGIGPVEVKSRRLAIVGAGRRCAHSLFVEQSCRNGRGERRAWTRCCRLFICAGFPPAISRRPSTALLGKDAPNLSPAVIARLKGEWEDEYRRWQKRDLSARRYVYVWADGVYLQARMEPQAECMLVLIGATPEGKKELIGFQTGMRESAQSWKELLVDLKARGLSIAPEVAIGDGALGFWRALDEAFPIDAPSAVLAAQDTECSRQAPEVRCSPMRIGTCAKSGCRRTGARRNRDDDIRRKIRAKIRQGRRMPSQGSRCAADVLRLSRRSLGRILRTSNPIESVFATVRHRTVRMKGALSQDTARVMVFKLVMAARKPGGDCKAKISCRRSSTVSNSTTESKSRLKAKSAA